MISARLARPRRSRRGDKVMLVPGHCDPTVNPHDWHVSIRNRQGRGAVADRRARRQHLR
jgi:D-serine deaminase-like pyridoxal phosphate-dependent protein